jgi:hypothetical protein
MKLTETETAALYREATARRERGPECLDDDLLLRASTNDLGASEREQIAAHIARCSDCAREYRVARAMRPFDADARAALGRNVPQWWAAAAAAVVMVAIALYGWRTTTALRDARGSLAFEQGELANARRELARARLQVRPTTPPSPQLGVPIVDVDPEPTRGPAAAPTAWVEVPSGTGEFALVLHLPPGIRAPAALAVVDENGAVVWRGTATHGLDTGTLTLALPRSLIRSGRYVVHVDKTAFPFRVTWR